MKLFLVVILSSIMQISFTAIVFNNELSMFGSSLFNLYRINSFPLTDYEQVRNNIIEAEESIRTGGNIYLSPKEQEADDILLRLKEKAIQNGILNSSTYAPSMHFFHAKPLIDKDPIFEIIQRVPKGAVLHLHNSAGVSSEWVIKNLTYRDDIKLCRSGDIKVFETM